MQRELEGAGVATVGISLLRRISEQVRPPRTYVVRYPFGHALGEPFRPAQHLAIFQAAVALLEACETPGQIVESPYGWRRDPFG